MFGKKYIALIPAYEPSWVLIDLLKELKTADVGALVVDDGSGEAYEALFKEASKYATVLRCSLNQGKGCALKMGMAYIQTLGVQLWQIVVTMDADGQHRVQEAVKICKEAEKNPNGLILGSRAFDGKVPAKNKFGNTVTRWVYIIATGVKVRDTQTGLRAFDTRLILFMMGIEGERYEYEMNVLLACPKEGIEIKEVEIPTIYIDNNASSHFKAIRDSYRIYKQILNFAGASLIGFGVDFVLYNVLIVLTAGLGASTGLIFSNVLARMVSASVNYAINRRFVFKSHRHGNRSAIWYFALAVGILFGNTVVLNVLVEGLAIHKIAAKLITEVLFLTISWLVQKYIIFNKHDKTTRDHYRTA